MGNFTNKLLVSPQNDGENWEVAEEFDFYLGKTMEAGKVIHVPQGFITNFASIPKMFWSLLGTFCYHE